MTRATRTDNYPGLKVPSALLRALIDEYREYERRLGEASWVEKLKGESGAGLEPVRRIHDATFNPDFGPTRMRYTRGRSTLSVDSWERLMVEYGEPTTTAISFGMTGGYHGGFTYEWTDDGGAVLTISADDEDTVHTLFAPVAQWATEQGATRAHLIADAPVVTPATAAPRRRLLNDGVRDSLTATALWAILVFVAALATIATMFVFDWGLGSGTVGS